jgi:hypothetical protein
MIHFLRPVPRGEDETDVRRAAVATGQHASNSAIQKLPVQTHRLDIRREAQRLNRKQPMRGREVHCRQATAESRHTIR